MRTLLLCAVALALVLSGCSASSAPVTEEQAKAAPARLKADMGPDGELSSMASTLEMSMSGEQNGQSMSMEMELTMDAEMYRGGGMGLTMRFVRFEASGDPGGMPPPTLDGVELRLTCLPDRWVLQTTGLATASDGKQQDVSLEARNSTGKCDLQDSSSAQDLNRLMNSMGPSGSTVRGMQGALALPELQFESLDGGTARYRIAGMDGGPMGGMGGMGMPTFTATFDEGRFATVTMAANASMGYTMRMEMRAEYSYGDRDAAPDVHGDRTV